MRIRSIEHQTVQKTYRSFQGLTTATVQLTKTGRIASPLNTQQDPPSSDPLSLRLLDSCNSGLRWIFPTWTTFLAWFRQDSYFQDSPTRWWLKTHILSQDLSQNSRPETPSNGFLTRISFHAIKMSFSYGVHPLPFTRVPPPASYSRVPSPPEEQHLHSSTAQTQGLAVIFKPALTFMPRSLLLANPAKATITVYLESHCSLSVSIVIMLVHAVIIFLVALCHFPCAAILWGITRTTMRTPKS